jgi:hypothetical protein
MLDALRERTLALRPIKPKSKHVPEKAANHLPLRANIVK